MSAQEGRTAWAEPGEQMVRRDELELRMDFYKESIVLRKFGPDLNRVRMVHPDEIADAFIQHMGLSSGLLPEGTLWIKQSAEGIITALHRPPAVWAAAVQEQPFEPPARLRIPMPGLVFVCAPGRTPWVFACRERPTRQDQPLYASPTFNTFMNGRVCPGSHKFPDEVDRIPESFFRSFFSLTGDTWNRSQKHPRDLHALWRELDGREEYPMEDLVQQCTVADAMDIPENPRRHGRL